MSPEKAGDASPVARGEADGRPRYNVARANRSEPYGSGRGPEAGERGPLSSCWETVEPEPARALHTMFGDGGPAAGPTSGRARGRRAPPDDDQTAVRKFGAAKAISSAQFFGDQDTRLERDANLSRFQGSNSISSAEYFGQRQPPPSFGVSAPDLDEVRESVRAGVTRVAGRLSSLANGVVSSLQERYGY